MAVIDVRPSGRMTPEFFFSARASDAVRVHEPQGDAMTEQTETVAQQPKRTNKIAEEKARLRAELQTLANKVPAAAPGAFRPRANGSSRTRRSQPWLKAERSA